MFQKDVDALWRNQAVDDDNSTTDNSVRSDSGARHSLVNRRSVLGSRRSSFAGREIPQNSPHSSFTAGVRNSSSSTRRSSFTRPSSLTGRNAPTIDMGSLMTKVNDQALSDSNMKKLVLPRGTRKYSDRCWLEKDIKTIRRDIVSSGVFFPKFDQGLKSYYNKDWEHAKQCFELILSSRDDGPTIYFMEQMEKHDFVPPKDFDGYRVVEQ
ncbi:hypothetical protein THAOC_08507 [Thalassiosira oceanica]|uniref:Uncharacterized protein n=1 Tax=Thalassiosira oceanica TaxID=159749 RepID=K0SXM4_THAOC|nr:hypothetical protein THAOC_08507 [Thalassiosira oceanica]|eukprot:EJK70155.1 hypothetical protein THAOC_08507 [Thalassiosira oceanica]